MTYFSNTTERKSAALPARQFTSELKAKTGIAGKSLYLSGELYAKLTRRQRTIFLQVLASLGRAECKRLLQSKGNLVALGRIAKHYPKRRRNLESWSPPKSSPKSWIADLIDHLFASYPAPNCLAQIWFRQDVDYLEEWYFPVAAGESLRSMKKTPIPITKKMAHILRNETRIWGTPTLMFRWAQLEAMGASQSVLCQILASTQGQATNDEDFWTPIFEFFVRHYDPATGISISDILDYIGRVYAVSEEGKKNFRTRGRTMESLARATDEWHQELHARQLGVNLKWKPQEIGGFEFHEAAKNPGEKAAKYFISELCNGPELAKEGRTMGHCVASYQAMCAEGKCSIWSLRKQLDDGKLQPLVTMEMDSKEKRLVQIKARFNARPEKYQLDIIRKWCGREGLSISNHAI